MQVKHGGDEGRAGFCVGWPRPGECPNTLGILDLACPGFRIVLLALSLPIGACVLACCALLRTLSQTRSYSIFPQISFYLARLFPSSALSQGQELTFLPSRWIIISLGMGRSLTHLCISRGSQLTYVDVFDYTLFYNVTFKSHLKIQESLGNFVVE